MRKPLHSCVPVSVTVANVDAVASILDMEVARGARLRLSEPRWSRQQSDLNSWQARRTLVAWLRVMLAAEGTSRVEVRIACTVPLMGAHRVPSVSTPAVRSLVVLQPAREGLPAA